MLPSPLNKILRSPSRRRCKDANNSLRSRRWPREDALDHLQPVNGASRKTAERAGAKFIEIREIPSRSPMYAKGERMVARYLIDL